MAPLGKRFVEVLHPGAGRSMFRVAGCRSVSRPRFSILFLFVKLLIAYHDLKIMGRERICRTLRSI